MRDHAYETPFLTGPGAPHAFGPNLILHSEPYPLGLMARLGHPDAQQPEVGVLARRLYEFLFTQIASSELAVGPVAVPTRMTAAHPEQIWEGHVVTHEQRVVVADVARAGILGSQLFYERFNEILDPVGVRQDHLFVSRKVDGHGRVVGAEIVGAKIGGPLEGATLVIPDPMGATGGSLLEVLEHYASSGAGRAARVVFAHLIVTPEYVVACTPRSPTCASTPSASIAAIPAPGRSPPFPGRTAMKRAAWTPTSMSSPAPAASGKSSTTPGSNRSIPCQPFARCTPPTRSPLA